MMSAKTADKKGKRFRRVTKARILDGHPLKLSVQAVTVMVVSYMVITSLISLLFSYFYGAQYYLVLWTLLPGASLGFSLLVLERTLAKLKNYMFSQIGKLLTAFLLFFIHSIGYLALSSVVVNYPVGHFMAKTDGMAGMGGKYSLFFVNFIIVLSLFSWLRNVRSLPNRCF